MFELVLALGLDMLLGDPEWLPHPIVGVGKLISAGENFIRPRVSNQRLAGILLVGGVVGTTVGSAVFLIHLGYWIHPLLGKIISVYLIFTALALRSLEQAAKDVYLSLRVDDLEQARLAVSCIVGRDAQQMREPEIARATIESVAENAVDGVIAPFFFALLGGAPLALGYKAINTLDSMVGYRNQRYRYFGWASARLDDAANYIPARLCYILIPAAAGLKQMAKVLNIMARDGRKHPSPNSGLAEAGFAAALDIQLGGDNYYEGKLKPRPLLGDKIREIDREDIPRATTLLSWGVFVLLCLSILSVIAIG